MWIYYSNGLTTLKVFQRESRDGRSQSPSDGRVWPQPRQAGGRHWSHAPLLEFLSPGSSPTRAGLPGLHPGPPGGGARGHRAQVWRGAACPCAGAGVPAASSEDGGHSAAAQGEGQGRRAGGPLKQTRDRAASGARTRSLLSQRGVPQQCPMLTTTGPALSDVGMPPTSLCLSFLPGTHHPGQKVDRGTGPVGGRPPSPPPPPPAPPHQPPPRSGPPSIFPG